MTGLKNDRQPGSIRRRSTGDLVYESLREAILANEFSAGTHLVEADLARHFAVSKTPIREAVQRLAANGLVEVALARGAFVRTFTTADMVEVVEMRLLIEPHALRQSFLSLSEGGLDGVRAVLADARQALFTSDYVTLSKLDSRFHRLLYRAASNHYLQEWIRELTALQRLVSLHTWAIENRTAQELEEHHAIVAALETGDCDHAVLRLEAHLQQTRRVLNESG